MSFSDQWTEPSRIAVVKALNKFIDAPTKEKCAFLERDQALLLTDEADRIFTTRINNIQKSGDSQMVVTLQFHRSLLRRARGVGIPTACEELTYLVDSQAKERFSLFLRCLAHPTPRQVRHCFEQHHELLEADFDKGLEVYIAYFERNPDLTESFRSHLPPKKPQEMMDTIGGMHHRLEILRDARRRGGTITSIREAFVNRYGGGALDVPSWFEEKEVLLEAFQDRELYKLAENETIATLRNLIKLSQDDPHIAPETLAELQYVLAAALLRQNHYVHHAQPYETAIEACALAFQVYTHARYPYRHAKVQKCLGDLYLQRVEGMRKENLERAISCYKAALQELTREAFPRMWAETQVDLSWAYRERIDGTAKTLYVKSHKRERKSKVSVREAASRAGKQVYHAGQGQDERTEASRPHAHAPWPRSGLDSTWSLISNPHRESGTRWWAAADVGATGPAAGAAHGQQEGRDGNRLGDSVGAQTACTGEGLRSAERVHRGMTERRSLDSGDVLPGRVSLPRRFKGRGLIAGLVHPHGIDDAHPDVSQGAQRHTVGFALRPFALVIRQRPGFLLRRLPGKLVQGVAQGFQAGEAFMRFGVIAAFIGHGRGSGQGLDRVGIGIAATIITPFGQQTWSQAFASPRQRTPQFLIVMPQKKGADGLVIASDLLDHDQQLLDQRQHQARLGTHDDLACHQLGTVQFRNDLGSHPPRVGMFACAQGGRDLLKRGSQRGLRRGIGLQKQQGGALLQFGKQLQGRRVVLLEAGCQLVHQARLRLDQRILIAGERLQLLHRVAIRGQAAQFRQVNATQFGQQMRINAVGLGSCRFAQLIGALRVHRVHGDTRFQQEGDEQAVIRLDNAGQLLGRSRNAEQKGFQLVQTVVAVGKASCSYTLASLILHFHVMMGVGPVQSNVPHVRLSFSSATPGGVGSLYNGCSKQRPSNHRLAQESCQGKDDLCISVKPCGEPSLSQAVRIQQADPCKPLVGRA